MSLLQSVTSSPDSVDALQQAVRASDGAAAREGDANNLNDTTGAPPDGSVPSPPTCHSENGLGGANQSSTHNAAPETHGGNPDIESPLRLTDDEQQHCLDIFRSEKLPYCPFLRLSPAVSLQTLQRDRPFLLKAITTVATPSVKSRIARGTELKTILSHEVVLENKSSMDLLLALLTFVAWSYDQYLTKKSLSRLVSLAMLVVRDLRLHVRQSTDGAGLSLTNRSIWAKQDGGDAEAGWRSEDGRLERARAVLGCFVLSSW